MADIEEVDVDLEDISQAAIGGRQLALAVLQRHGRLLLDPLPFGGVPPGGYPRRAGVRAEKGPTLDLHEPLT